MAAKTINRYTCKSCHYQGSRYAIILHVVQHHLSDSDVPYLCQACPDTKGRNRFKDKREAINHQRLKHPRMGFQALFTGSFREILVGTYATAIHGPAATKPLDKNPSIEIRGSEKTSSSKTVSPATTTPNTASTIIPALSEQLALSDDEILLVHPPAMDCIEDEEPLAKKIKPSDPPSPTAPKAETPASIKSVFKEPPHASPQPAPKAPSLMSLKVSVPKVMSIPPSESTSKTPVAFLSPPQLTRLTTELAKTNSSMRGAVAKVEHLTREDVKSTRATKNLAREIQGLHNLLKPMISSQESLAREIRVLSNSMNEYRKTSEAQADIYHTRMAAIAETLRHQTELFEALLSTEKGSNSTDPGHYETL